LRCCSPPAVSLIARGPAAARTSNFGGYAGELWCDGGELGFVQRLITQSRAVPDRCRWFTTLVSKSERLPRLHAALRLG
jgi:23S rRNA (adenine1618-N6)-methyltransferase